VPFGTDFKPRARTGGLVVERLAQETLVYDAERHRAHCLNSTAARIWGLCDGKTAVAGIAERVGMSVRVEVPEEAIWLGLRRLAAAHLLEEEVPEVGKLSRRRVLRTLGRAAAVALPLVSSILVPSGALAGMTCSVGRIVSVAECKTGQQQFWYCCCQNGKMCMPGGTFGASC
jgi:hypothetical protein